MLCNITIEEKNRKNKIRSNVYRTFEICEILLLSHFVFSYMFSHFEKNK